VRLIVFDLDGTLIDSRRDIADATNALLAGLGARPLDVETVAAMVGEGAALLVRRALAAAGLDPATPGAQERFLRLYDERLTRHTRPYDGMAGVLEELSEAGPLAVLTNKPDGAAARVLEALGLAQYFDAVIGGDSRFGRKPDPAGLRHLMERAGADPGSTLLVGDSPVDLETARRAGTRICLARYGFGFDFEETAFQGDELFISEPAALLSVLRTSG
jgi:phosphoglycolate phosphatase